MIGERQLHWCGVELTGSLMLSMIPPADKRTLACTWLYRLVLTQAVSDVLDVLAIYSNSSTGSGCSTPLWWAAACADAGRLLLVLISTAVSPRAAGGCSGSSGGGSAGSLLQLMWRLGVEICSGIFLSDVVTLGWLLLCVNRSQVRSGGPGQMKALGTC